jgi:pyruvate kinase
MAQSVKSGQQILVADGSLVLTVLSTDLTTGDVSCRIENNATIGERKNMNLPGVIVDLPTFTEKDVDGTCRLTVLPFSNLNANINFSDFFSIISIL